MQPPQSLHNQSNILHINSQPRHNLLLHSASTVQKPFDQIAIHEPKWLLRLAYLVLERAVFVKGHVSGTLDEFRHVGLQTHEEVLFLGRDEGEQVD